MEAKPTLGEMIAAVRKARSLQQRELADTLGVSLSTLSSWERGLTEPNASSLLGLCDALRVACDVLLDRVPFELHGAPATTAAPVRAAGAPASQRFTPRETGAPTWDRAMKDARRAALNGQSLHNLMLRAKKEAHCPRCGAARRVECAGGTSCMDRKMALAAAVNVKRGHARDLSDRLDAVPVSLDRFEENGATFFRLESPEGPVIACEPDGDLGAADISVDDLHVMSAAGWIALAADGDNRPLWWIVPANSKAPPAERAPHPTTPHPTLATNANAGDDLPNFPD